MEMSYLSVRLFHFLNCSPACVNVFAGVGIFYIRSRSMIFVCYGFRRSLLSNS